MFDYAKSENEITVGYRLNEDYWNKKIASNALKLMMVYLVNKIGITTLKAFVMPEKLYSSRILTHTRRDRGNSYAFMVITFQKDKFDKFMLRNEESPNNKAESCSEELIEEVSKIDFFYKDI